MDEEQPDTGTNLGILVPTKRKQGRPRKDLSIVPLGEKSPILQKQDGRGRKPRRKKSDVTWPVVDSSFIGQQVNGILDGSFDAGYLLTVRVGDSQTVLRGVVFEPNLCVPISRSNDVAPNVRFERRNEQVLPSVHQLVPVTNAVVSPPHLSVTPPVFITNLAASRSTLFKDSEAPPLPAASIASSHALNRASELESGSSKPAVPSQDFNDNVSCLHRGQPDLPSKVESNSEGQMQTT